MSKSIRSPRRFSSYDSKPKEPRPGRWDIQGLRAFAVLAVVADHLTKWPKGGFVGVDVFFVISGFLITGLLVRERQRTGKISFVGFYRRRAKRILPAAVVVLGLTALISHNAFNAVRAKSIDTDALWALGFSANWHFRSIGTDYFTASNAISPLQHYWSLSIEEQFYFVWPWLMLAIFAVLAARVSFSTARVVIFGVITAATVASFAWALHETSTNATGAYFSTFSRAWELGLGAMCAVAAPQLHKIPDAIRPVLAWIGLATMTVSLFVVSSDSGFPAPWAALPVFATALVIAAGTHAEKGWQQPFLFPLTNPVSNYIGDVSYSLYLWHFPVIIIGKATMGETNQDLVYLGVIMVLLSVFSYHLIEDPVRHSTLFEMTRDRRKRHRTAYFPTVSGDQFRYTALAFVICFMLGATALAFKPVDQPKTVALEGGKSSDQEVVSREGDAPSSPKLTNLQAGFAKAITADAWPKLTPSIETAVKEPEAPPAVERCGHSDAPPIDQCTFGDKAGKHAIVVIGDSISMTYSGVLSYAIRPQSDWKVIVLGMFGCPYTASDYKTLTGNLNQTCPERKAKTLAVIADIKPDLVLFSNLSSHEPEDDRGTMVKQFVDQLSNITPARTKIALVTTPPEQVGFLECDTPGSVPADCLDSRGTAFTQDVTQLSSVAGKLANAKVVNTGDLFCRFDQCPAFVDGVPIFIDGRHMTPAYQEHVAPVFLEMLIAQKLLPKSLA